MRKEAIAQIAARLRVDATKSRAAERLVRSMTQIAEAADAFDTRARELRADINWSDVGRRRQLETLAAQSNSLLHAEGAIEMAKSHINTRRAAMKPQRDPSDLVGEMRRQELRAYVRSLPLGERLKAAFADPVIADAVGDALPALSGLTAEQAADIAEHVYAAHPEAAELAEMEEGITAVHSASVLLRDLMAEHLDGPAGGGGTWG